MKSEGIGKKKKVKGLKKKKAGIAILLSDKIDFKTKTETKKGII